MVRFGIALLIAIAVFGTGLLAVSLYERGYLRFAYPSSSQYPIRGVDISHHQKTVNWSALAQAGVHFVYMKASEGSDFVDPAFAHNWQASKATPLLRGAYHFFTFASSGARQAEHFIATVPAEHPMLPPAIDLEYGGNSRVHPTKEVLLRELGDFVARVEQAFGVRPVVYVTRDSYKDYLSDQPTYDRIWIRNLFWDPNLSPRAPWLFWQFANRARVAGIEGLVDLNVFHGSFEQLRQLAK